MKNQLINKALIVFILSVFIILSACSHKNTEIRSLFSWKDNEVLEGRNELFKTMNNLNINTLYQSFSAKLYQEDIQTFLLDAKKADIAVNLLDGDPRWALEKDGGPMIKAIERVVKINNTLDKGTKIKAIIFDVEPYLLEDWNDQTNEQIMNDFVTGMKTAYKTANKNDLKMILCIPYFYDNMGFSKQLDDLIKSGCDTIAIMNYYKDKEITNIKLEVAIANKYGKEVVTIYELQAPGTHDLSDKNTYYNDGIEAINENFNNLKEAYQDITIAFHEYRSLKEVIDLK